MRPRNELNSDSDESFGASLMAYTLLTAGHNPSAEMTFPRYST